ncbi:HTH-type transcriptional repressor YvoA [Caprobacter fermentans]|uniref:HTH-type transcriptional repressor YvoA n=1 Tax=Caproicibacter fermentans TaxID=2576756 RepID=A0A6N8HW41_9FIRM|nr:GntR family transcriptional regulator [Caproicibacter fermentans]MVB10006.1 HTH-type transcriptional repressor YvoA [Caproicibacter fermentans]OCN02595.1 GntR family transcriptional regulator [Clostridium sp. W14A]
MSNDHVIDYHAPIYLQLREVVRSKIEEGEYLPGMAIPSENELADFYGINRLTVRNAIDALVGEGMLKRVQGKGVYVVGSKIERDLETLGGFRQTMREKHARPGTKILVKTQRRAGIKYAHIFGIEPEDMLYYIRRLGLAEGEPISLEEILVPHDVVPKLEGIDLSVFSLYEVYDFYGIHLKRAWQTLDIAEPEASDARMLNIDPGLAVLLFTCVSYDENDRVIEYSRSYTRGDKCNFSVHFHQ